MAITGLKGRASGYNFFCNDVNGNFGTDATSSGTPISPNQFTAAIPMGKDEEGKPRTPFLLGDVLLVKNNITGKSILVLATDVGGLPNADIDLVDGVTTKSLGMEAKYSTGGGVIGLSNATDIEVVKVGNVDYKDKAKVRTTLDTIAKINRGEDGANLQTLASSGVLRNKEEGIKWDQTLTSYAANLPKQAEWKRTGGYTDRDPTKTRREQTDLMAMIKMLPEEDQMFVMMILMIAGMMTGEAPEQLLNNSLGQILGNPQTSKMYEEYKNEAHNYNKDYKVKEAPDGWGKPTPEAVAAVMSGKADVIYQEQRGNGFVSYGTLTTKNEKGEVVSYPVMTGGKGKGSLPGTPNGTEAKDPRYPNAVEIPDYTITNFRGRNAAGMVAFDKSEGKSVGFSFDILSKGKDYVEGTGRGEFRAHPDGGGVGSLGCIVCHPDQSTEFAKTLASKGDSLSFKLLPSLDNKNELATHFKSAPQQGQGEKKSADSSLPAGQIPDIRRNVPAAPKAPAPAPEGPLKPVDPATLPKTTTQVAGKSSSANIG